MILSCGTLSTWGPWVHQWAVPDVPVRFPMTCMSLGANRVARLTRRLIGQCCVGRLPCRAASALIPQFPAVWLRQTITRLRMNSFVAVQLSSSRRCWCSAGHYKDGTAADQRFAWGTLTVETRFGYPKANRTC